MSTTSKLSIFDEMFPDEGAQCREIAEKYKNAEIDKGEARAMVESLADSIIEKEEALHLSFPFRMDKETLKKIRENRRYYLHTYVIEHAPKGTGVQECAVCGNRLNDLYVHDWNSNVSCCLECVDPSLSIDGESYRIMQLDLEDQ